MPTLYRTLDLSSKKILYVRATNKAQARSHVSRKIIQVEVASTEQIVADVAAKLDVSPVDAGDE